MNNSNNNVITDLIPCEICNLPINFTDYISHLETCEYNRGIPPAINITQNNEIYNAINRLITGNNTQNINVSGFSNIASTSDPRANSTMFNQGFYHRTTRFNPIIQRPSAGNIPMQTPIDNNVNSEREEPEFIVRSFGTPGSFFQPMSDLFGQDMLRDVFGPFINSINTQDEFAELNNLEDVVVGIEDIDEVSSIILYNEIVDQGHECIACKESIEALYTANNDTVFRKTICNHVHCDECLTRWLSLRKTCPTCNQCLETLLNHINSTNSNNSYDPLVTEEYNIDDQD